MDSLRGFLKVNSGLGFRVPVEVPVRGSPGNIKYTYRRKGRAHEHHAAILLAPMNPRSCWTSAWRGLEHQECSSNEQICLNDIMSGSLDELWGLSSLETYYGVRQVQGFGASWLSMGRATVRRSPCILRELRSYTELRSECPQNIR